MRTIYAAFCLFTVAAARAPAQGGSMPTDARQRFADLGSCPLVSGESITDCRLGYRTYGTLSRARDNAVLIPTWFLGTSAQWEGDLGPAGLVDSTRYYVIVVDALGNGRSSSPSNNKRQPGAAFPRFTIRDMVESQHQLLTKRLGITHLRAVVGTSMGGMQTLEWGVAHPEFADRLVALVGTPRPASYDRVLWQELLSTIENGQRHGVPGDTVAMHIARVFTLVLTTPQQVNERTPDSTAARVAADAHYFFQNFALDDIASQLRAMLAHDVSARHGGDLARAAAAVRARTLVVYSPDDHTVTYEPVRDFARLLKADTLSVPSACGHLAPGCAQKQQVNEVVRRFLAR
jgi:homoserine O-acetyltransferase